ncbi:MAG: chemotaxis protein CheX [Planctomycetota bacterium]
MTTGTNTRWREALADAARQALEQMVSMTPDSCEDLDATVRSVTADVVSVLGFAGNRSGLLTISCPRDLAWRVSAGMLFADPSELEQEEVSDAMGEISNLVLGGFKNTWVEAGHDMQMSVPSVSIGIGPTVNLGANPVEAYALGLQLGADQLRIDLRFLK